MCGKAHFSYILLFPFIKKKKILLKFSFTLAGPIQLLPHHDTELLGKKKKSNIFRKEKCC